jgi:hypothetical protein
MLLEQYMLLEFIIEFLNSSFEFNPNNVSIQSRISCILLEDERLAVIDVGKEVEVWNPAA